MRWMFVGVVLAACSAPDVRGSATIASARCTNPSTTGYTLDADFVVMLEADEEVELDAEPSPAIGPSAAMDAESWTCGEWALIGDDGHGHAIGCKRGAAQTAMVTVSVTSVVVYTLGQLPTPLKIDVSPTVVDAGRGDDKATMTIDCQ